MKIEITDKLYSDIVEYCKVNNIEDVDKFIKRIINQGFSAEKWGTIGKDEKIKTEIKIVEKIIISAVTSQQIEEKIVTEKTDNIDLYGERNVRKI